MFGVIRKYHFDEHDHEEIDSKIREFFVPQLRQIPGFISYYWLETGEGTGASMTVFEDKAGADESVRIAVEFTKAHLPGLKIPSPEITEGTIQAHS